MRELMENPSAVTEGPNDKVSSNQSATHANRNQLQRSGFAVPKNWLITEATHETLAALKASGKELSPAQLNRVVLHNINLKIKEENRRRKDEGSNIPNFGSLSFEQTLSPGTVGEILLATRTIASIDLAGGQGNDFSGMTVLGVYGDFPGSEKYGLYDVSERTLNSLIIDLEQSMVEQGKINAVRQHLETKAPVRIRNRSARFIPVANGVFDRADMELKPFSEDHVFLTKSPVRYVKDAPEPRITEPDGNVWTVSGWIDSLSEDEGVPELLWEVLSAVMRSNERWDQAAFLHSDRGNNGKGTYCSLARNLVGPGAHTSIPISKFDKPFALAGLVMAQTIITDENPVGAFAKDLDDFKAVITGDQFTLERKYKDPIAVSFSGMVIQCVNDFPQSRDKSSSYARRQLFIPFKKWFGGDGVERKYIKHDFLKRQDVLEYVLHRVLHMTHTEFSKPPVTQELLAEATRQNDPVKEFWYEISEELVWDFQPKAWLYGLFQQWFKAGHPSGTLMSRKAFFNALMATVREDKNWEILEDDKKHRPGQMMNAPEPLIKKYEVADWMNPAAKGSRDVSTLCMPELSANYRGGLRRVSSK